MVSNFLLLNLKLTHEEKAIIYEDSYYNNLRYRRLWLFLSDNVQINEISVQVKYIYFSIRVFFDGQWRLTGQQGKGGGPSLFYSITSTRSRTFRHLFVTLHVKWISHIFNRTACIYQTTTRWDLPLYRITIWLIDDVTLVFLFFCLRDDLILAFLLHQFKTGNR